MKLRTHRMIDESLCGRLTRLEKGYAEVWLSTHRMMVADREGLVHGGFIFGAADYAAMAAVNDPNVVLGAAESRFIAPVRKGETVCFVAKTKEHGRKRVVLVVGKVGRRRVFEGRFTTFVLSKHVLAGE